MGASTTPAPIGQLARQYALPLDDDPSLPWFEAAKAISRKRMPQAMAPVLPETICFPRHRVRQSEERV